MSSFPKFRAIQYIEDFAKFSQQRFKWQHDQIFNQSMLLAIASIKTHFITDPSYITLFDKLIAANAAIFKVLMLRVHQRVIETNQLNNVLKNPDLEGDQILFFIFDEVYMRFENDLREKFSEVQLNKLAEVVETLRMALIYLSFQFINTAYHKNLIDVLIEELYLLREIDYFKNRQD